MRLRKSHSKSRAGCLPCKRKHVKCGEELTACQNCINRGVECIYGQIQPTNAEFLAANSLPHEYSSSDRGERNNESEPLLTRTGNKGSPYSSVPNFTRLDELQLLLHYVNVTSETISQDSDDLFVWKRAVPDEAVHHEFLMDGLLALSSLHFAFEHPDKRARYFEIAMHYQNTGLQKYTKATHHIIKENSYAIFAYSVITNIMALACPTVGQELFEFSYTESIASYFELLQGVGVINRIAGSFLKDSYFKVLWRPDPLDENPPKLPADTDVALSKLRQRANDIAKYLEPERLEVYLSSIEKLELASRFVNTTLYLRNVMAWPAMTDKRLLEFFRRGDPMAKLIFLHYGVLLLGIRESWWGRDYGLRLIEELTASICTIDPEWTSWTEWARDSATKATGRTIPVPSNSTPVVDES